MISAKNVNYSNSIYSQALKTTIGVKFTRFDRSLSRQIPMINKLIISYRKRFARAIINLICQTCNFRIKISRNTAANFFSSVTQRTTFHSFIKIVSSPRVIYTPQCIAYAALFPRENGQACWIN